MTNYIWRPERFNDALKQRGFTQSEFADAMNEYIRINGLKDKVRVTDQLKQQTIHRWATGKQNPSANYIPIIAIVLDADMNYLYGIIDALVNPNSLNETELELLEAYKAKDLKAILSILNDG